MASTSERLDAVEKAVATLAEIIGTGTAGHITSPGSNPALDIARKYKPVAAAPEDPLAPSGEMCLKKRKPDQDDEGEVCILAKNHEGGHAYSYPPKPVPVQAP